MALHLCATQCLFVIRGNILVGMLPYGVRQAGLADLAVLQPLLRDNVPPILCDTEMLRLYQIVQALGVIEIVDAVVAHGQILHSRRLQRLCDPGGDI